MKVGGFTATTEDYLKAILEIGSRSSGNFAPMGEIADALEITPGTVTTMIRRLSDDGLLEYKPRVGCALSSRGRNIALRMLRRHRILETFLVQSLKMDWADVHMEAERMEHNISDQVIDRLWTFLGRPGQDPHGGVIPDENLGIGELAGDWPLSEMVHGTEATLTRMPDRDPSLLKALRGAGMAPGVLIRLERPLGTGTLKARGPDGSVSLSLEVARNIRGRPVPESGA